jgi:hypothetical protein
MPQALPHAEVLRTYVDEKDHLPVLCLRWPGQADGADRLWELPEGVSVVGPPPQRFGFSAQRLGESSYAVRVLWDRTCLSWASLSRMQLLTSCLAPLLGALGSDLWCLLDQPVPTALRVRPRAA